MPPPPTTPATAVGQEADRQHGQRQHQAGAGFHQQHAQDDLQFRCAHGVRGFDHAARHFAQVLFDQAREVGDGGERQRHGGGQRADGGAGDDAREAAPAPPAG
jgi:hypothetical protein